MALKEYSKPSGFPGTVGRTVETSSPAPHIDALAADGLRYTNLHTTALCSPSRSCILTERNHNSNHMGCLSMSAASPDDRRPLGRGFERYYGFLGGDARQFYPELTRDNSQTEPERTPEAGYHLTEDLVEKARSMVADSKQEWEPLSADEHIAR
jgi:arylsulfatase